MFKNKKLFRKSLEALKVKRVYTDNFTAEQVFLQLKEATDDRLSEIESIINKEYKKIGDLKDESAEYNEIEEEDSNASSNDLSNNLSKEESEGDSLKNELLKDEISKDEYESVSETTFNDSDWSHCQSEDDEILNRPADEVIAILNSKKDFKKN